MTIFDTQAQEMKAKKMEGHTWHQVVMVKFKPGTVDKAKNIIDNHFVKAGMEANVPGPTIMEFKTGEWDMMFVWKMNSINDMEWEIHPDDEKWWAAMVAQEGNEEKAMKVWQDYMNIIENSTTVLATSRDPSRAETMGSN
jgi:hypothetical protein